MRRELHALLKALAEKRYEDARAALRPGEIEWTPDALAQAMAPYFAEHPAVDLTPAARRPHNTVLTLESPKRWSALQKIVDPTGEADWVVECRVDLSAAADEDAPLLELLRIGT